MPLALGAVAVWWLLPRPGGVRRIEAVLIGLAALISMGLLLAVPSGEWVRDFVFYLFAGAAIISATLMITNRDPVYAALWFALVTLSVCGLFLLRSAAFLAAATAIVYAGAIIVVFLFVIMLARQMGTAGYDQRPVQPLAATLTAFLLLGGLLYVLQDWGRAGETYNRPAVVTGETQPDGAQGQYLSPPEPLAANVLSEPAEDAEFGTMRGLGRSLFGDYLFAVELAGTLLLMAAIGAIAIAPRRPRGTL
ncbi:MAG: NADH-quinone oxidoreductase subunit J family protein [Planctomycetaceae bacterium]